MIPRVGFGLYQIPAAETKEATLRALSLGYRHLDCASFYGNEARVGEAISESGIPRSELFVATKVWTDCIGLGPEAVTKSLLKSLQLLRLEYCDLAYVHWPVPGHVDAYRALERLRDAGKVKAVGVSNYRIQDLEELGATPVANQIEVNPWMYRRETIDYFRSRGIQIVAYKPLLRGAGLDDPGVARIAQARGVSPAQILLRWGTHHGFSVIPKSSNADRMAQNLRLDAVDLAPEDLAYLDNLTTPESYATFEAHFQKRAVVDKDGPTLPVYYSSSS
ncbi:hypothetical protein CTAYLR_000679 [Chrysophaeum taylorii]|uniref:NADP-dependent oxidoreductase domain-containing protein n=1 Tax=Chrysophaeum taylorii TaxID=2483200 RepID=A0AAD7UAE8_9STRA|nr:hypothetical protein CTAYLR_000679 [Chrysophaeum taylorii]